MKAGWTYRSFNRTRLALKRLCPMPDPTFRPTSFNRTRLALKLLRDWHVVAQDGFNRTRLALKLTIALAMSDADRAALIEPGWH